MELLREWFVWGESDLFFYGICIIIIAALLPWKPEKSQKNKCVIAVCLAIYAVCELVVTFWFQNWFCAYICLFSGGIAFSIAVGRTAKIAWLKLLNKK